jgi:hypothetical protein
MKTIDAALSAAQKTGAGAAIARAALADNNHLHLTTQLAPTDIGHVAAVNTGTSIVRIVRNNSNAKIQRQIISDPTVLAQWNAWTDLASNALADKGALFDTGGYLVAVWQDQLDADIKYARSADGGSTWSAPAVAYALTISAAFCGVSGGATHSGIFLGSVGQLYWGAYTPGTDTWAALDSAAITATDITYVAAAYDATNTRWIVAFTAAGFAASMSYPVILIQRSAAGAWGTPHVQFAIAGGSQSYNGLAISQGTVLGYWWLSVLRQADWTSSEYGLACSDDGLEFEDLNFQTTTADSGLLQVLGALGGSIWVASRTVVWKHTAQTFWSNRLVKSYELDLSGDMGRLTVDVVNQDGALTAAPPRRFAVLTLERGLNIGGVDYYVSAGTYTVFGFHFNLQDAIVRVAALDAIGLITRWEADQQFHWDNETLRQLVRFVCALAGVHVCTFDAAAVWAEALTAFTIQPSSSGLAALDSLAARGNFEVVVQESGALYCFVPGTVPAADHTYGLAAAQHNYWPGDFGEGLAPNYVAVYPEDEATSRASFDAPDMTLGRRQSDAFIDRRLTSGPDVAELSAARLFLAQELRRLGELEAPVNFALEPGDVLAFGAHYEAAYAWRVTGFVERYGLTRSRPFFQHLLLRGATIFAALLGAGYFAARYFAPGYWANRYFP